MSICLYVYMYRCIYMYVYIYTSPVLRQNLGLDASVRSHVVLGVANQDPEDEGPRPSALQRRVSLGDMGSERLVARNGDQNLVECMGLSKISWVSRSYHDFVGISSRKRTNWMDGSFIITILRMLLFGACDFTWPTDFPVPIKIYRFYSGKHGYVMGKQHRNPWDF